VAALAIILMVAAVAIAKCDPFGGIPWPSHVEWTMYRVPSEGWALIRPATEADSVATKFVALPLSAGTEIYVPRLVPGADPKAEADARLRKVNR
jgi:hypothetical protein